MCYNLFHMNSETKLFAGIIAATFVIIVGAAFVFGRPTNTPPVDPKLLVTEDSYKFGSGSAVTLVEFGDFQCPACGAYHTVVKQLMEKYKDSMTLVFRHFPLNIHPNAVPASLAVEAAGVQGKFWEMYDKMYVTQSAWSNEKNPGDIFAGYAKDMGLDVEKFKKDMADPSLKKRIDRDVADATTLGINATPSFYVNNVKISNPASLEEFDMLLKTAIEKSATPSSTP